MDQRSFIACCDCGHLNEVKLLLLTSDGYLLSMTKCSRCVQRGDKRSLRGKIEIDAQSWYWAANHGLPVIEVRK